MALQASAVVTGEREEQLVVCKLGEESYGVAIEAVNTIIRFPEITRVPQACHFLEGVMNLRGTIVPIIDLHKRFDLPTAPVTKSTRIMVVEHHDLLVGMIVDEVTETLRIPSINIEPLSSLALSINAQYIRGVGKVQDRLIILLALEKILSLEEQEVLKEVIDE